MYLMKPYDEALQEILERGVEKSNQRTGVKTLSIFGMLKRYPLDTGYFPILTKRKTWPKSVFSELLWYLEGSTSNDRLRELGCNFWTPWVDEEFERRNGFESGAFGPVYGFQLRHFGGNYGNGVGGPAFTSDTYIVDGESSPAPQKRNGYGFGGFDQLAWVVNRIKQDSSCRRILWTLWNPQNVNQMRLPPCHLLYQILIDDQRRLTGIMYQRSCDFPIGVPANIQFYSAITTMIAHQTDCVPYEFVHVTADSHIYWDQIEAVKEYLALPEIESPKLEIRKAKDIFSYTLDDFVLTDFNPGPKLEIPVAV